MNGINIDSNKANIIYGIAHKKTVSQKLFSMYHIHIARLNQYRH